MCEEMAKDGGEKVASPSLCPWLVSYHSVSKKQTFYSNITGPSAAVKTYYKRIAALEGKLVLSCSYGWLVLYDRNKRLLSLCNSTTFDTVLLPRLRQVSDHGVTSCVLVPNKNATCLDDLDNFKILIFLKYFPAIMCGWVGADDEDWTETRYWKYVKPYLPREWLRSKENQYLFRDHGVMIFRRAVVCGGKIFAQLGSRQFVNFFVSLFSIEIVEDEEKEEGEGEFSVRLHFSEIEVPGGAKSRPDHYVESNKMYMVESNGELFFLYFWGATLVFKVYRLSLDAMRWERIKYLDDRAFFIGDIYSVSCPVPVCGSGCIYFTKFTRIEDGRKDGNLYCFHLKDQSVSVSPLSSTPWPRLRPIWIMPRFLLWDVCSRPIRIMPRFLLWPRDDHNNINHQIKYSTATSSISELDENRDKHSQLCNLPFDVLKHLASHHLIAKDYMNFRAASTICRSVAPPINWRQALSGSSEVINHVFPCPLLMFADQDRSFYKFVDPSINSIDNNHYLVKIPDPVLDHKIIRYSSHGWVLLSERDSDILLYNPFTRAIISYKNITPLTECLFLFPKSSSSIAIDDASSFCYVIGIDFSNDKDTILDFSNDKDTILVSIADDPWEEELIYYDGWIDYQCDNDWDFNVVTQISPVLFDDAFYFLDREGKLGKLGIDFETGECRWEVLDKPQKPSFDNCIEFSFHHNFLVECGGDLISVFLGSMGKWITVYKLNGDKDWESVTNLGSYDLYLSVTSCLAVQSNEGGNKIYFPALRDSEIVYFSMNTGKWHFSESRDSAPDICGTRWLVNSCWINPTW